MLYVILGVSVVGRGIGPVPCAIHHLTVGGKHGQERRGHEFVLGLCDWHHQGYLPQDCSSVKEAEGWYGYSYARTPAKFRQSFGSNRRKPALDISSRLLDSPTHTVPVDSRPVLISLPKKVHPTCIRNVWNCGGRTLLTHFGHFHVSFGLS